MQRPLAVALTGGIAAGKTEALQAFARHGAAVISSDDVVHRLYREDEGLQAALRDRWGDRVFRDGEVDRAEIGRIVFADRGELAWLEAELHPRVRSTMDEWLAAQTADVAVAEIPLLYETGGEQRFDRVVVVTAPSEVRVLTIKPAGPQTFWVSQRSTPGGWLIRPAIASPTGK